MRTKYLFFILVALVFSTRCSRYQRPYQDQPLVSPSGKYILTVPIEKAADKLHYWRVTISDDKGNVRFKDDSKFVGYLNVYWSWDKEERVWLENSDTGYVYYWVLDKTDHWRRYQCDHGHPEFPVDRSPDESGLIPKPLPCSLSPIKK